MSARLLRERRGRKIVSISHGAEPFSRKREKVAA